MKDGKEKGLKTTTVWLMLAVALFFDALQALLTFVGMYWLVNIIAYPTFALWFWLHGLNFFSLKRMGWVGGSFILELIPGLDLLPAFTVMIARIALPLKIQEVIPAADITKLDIMKR